MQMGTALEQDDVLPLTSAAQVMGVGYSMARDAMLRGEIEGSRRGRAWYVVRASLRTWLARQGVEVSTGRRGDDR